MVLVFSRGFSFQEIESIGLLAVSASYYVSKFICRLKFKFHAQDPPPKSQDRRLHVDIGVLKWSSRQHCFHQKVPTYVGKKFLRF